MYPNRISLDFTLVDQLLGSGFDTRHSWRSSMDWWWETKDWPEPGNEEWEQWWGYQERGIPLGADGRPQFVATPKRYATDLGDGAKVLFLLDEIQRLDASEAKHSAAQALLKRALIGRKLYGPGSDQAWHSAEFYYYLEERPSFVAGYRGGPVKPFWELADDEARTLVEGRLQVVRLPEIESPLALLRLLERKYPRGSSVPEAIYVRGLYYQSRQQFAKALDEYESLRKAYPKHSRSADALKQIERIHHADVLLGATHFYPADSQPSLSFAHRQAEKIDFMARPIDLPRYLRDSHVRSAKPSSRSGADPSAR